jgi:RNA polymerase sigma-70 factor (ECF subfamily)
LETTTHEPGNEQLTDEDLVRRVVAGEHRLYELLMRRHNRRLYRAIRAVLRNDAEVEDVMQEAYVNAYTHLADFRGSAKFATWLTRIAVYEAFARLRKGKRFVQQEDDEMEDVKPTPEEASSDRELGRVLERAIENLPETVRTVFVLRAVEELSTSETAEVLDIPDDTVKTRLHRARGMLQKQLLDRSEVFEFHLSRCDRVVDAVFKRLGVSRQPS